MKTLTRDNYKRIHDIACTTWKPKLQDWYGNKFAIQDEINIKGSEYKIMRNACTSKQHTLFDEIFGKDNKLESGKWYKNLENGILVCIEEVIDFNTVKGYGFLVSKEWCNDNEEWELNKYEKATKEEVKSALIEEAEKRGFREGVRVQSLNGITHKFTLTEFWHIDSEGAIWFRGSDQNGIIFENGKWAEIIEQPIERTYKIGQRFKDEYKETYILARTGNKNPRKIALISIKDGNMYSEQVKVKNRNSITQKELDIMCGTNGTFTLYKE